MSKCPSCNREIVKKDAKFCPFCGTPLNHEKINESSLKATPASNQQVKNDLQSHNINENPLNSKLKSERGPVTKRYKKYGIVLSLITVLVIGFFALKSIYNPYQVVEEADSAFKSKDAIEFFNTFSPSTKADYSEEGYYTAVSNYGWEDLKRNFDATIKEMENNQETVGYITDKSGVNMFLIEFEKVFGIFDTSTITALPQPLYASAANTETQIEISGEKVLVDLPEEEVLVGEFLAGTYEVESLINGNYGLLKTTETLELPLGKEVVYSPTFETKQIKLDGDFPEALVFMDGESTNMTIKELGVLTEVPSNSQVKTHAEFQMDDGTILSSNMLDLTSDSIYYKFEGIEEYNESQRDYDQEISDFYSGFRRDFETAVLGANFAKVEQYFIAGTKTSEDFKEFVEDHTQLGEYEYEFISNEVVDLKSNSETEFALTTSETFIFDSERDGNYLYERMKLYTIERNEDTYKLVSIENLETNKTRNN